MPAPLHTPALPTQHSPAVTAPAHHVPPQHGPDPCATPAREPLVRHARLVRWAWVTLLVLALHGLGLQGLGRTLQHPHPSDAPWADSAERAPIVMRTREVSATPALPAAPAAPTPTQAPAPARQQPNATPSAVAARTTALGPAAAPATAALDSPAAAPAVLSAASAAQTDALDTELVAHGAATLPEALELLKKMAPEPVDTAQGATNNIANSSPAAAQPIVLPAANAASVARADDATPAQPRVLAYPPSTRLLYDVGVNVRGVAMTIRGTLLWQHDASQYNARMEISHFLMGTRLQTSKGSLGPEGLQPTRFGDKVRSEVAAHFDRQAHKVTFSANTPDAALSPGMQDQLSAVLQLSALFGGDASQYPSGSRIAMDAVGPRSVEHWVFEVHAPETLQLPGAQLSALKLSRAAASTYGNRAELWLAPTLGYLPVRIRLTESNGDTADMQWRASETP